MLEGDEEAQFSENLDEISHSIHFVPNKGSQHVNARVSKPNGTMTNNN